MCNLVITANITVVYIWKLLRVRRSNQSILKEINSEHSLGRCWSWSSNTLATWREELTHWKRPWCWKRLEAGGEGDDRGWDGWMASLTWWTRVWVISGRWWWTGRPGVLWFTGSQRVGQDWATELNWTESCYCKNFSFVEENIILSVSLRLCLHGNLFTINMPSFPPKGNLELLNLSGIHRHQPAWCLI